MISFNAIPVGIRTPGSYVEFDNTRANPGLPAWPTCVLLMGQMLATGSAVANTVIDITAAPDGVALFGQGSMLDRMVRRAALMNAGATKTYAIALPDAAGGVKATYTLTFTAGPTVAGSLPLYIAGQSVPVGVNAGDSVATVATEVAAAVNADNDLPVTAVAAGSVVTLTCKWKGLTGNAIDIRLAYETGDVIPTGLAMTTAAAIAGAGDPDPTAAIAALGDHQYNFVAFPWSSGTALGDIITEFANRRGPLEQIDGLVFTSLKGSQGSLATFGQGLNSPDLSASECVGPATPWERCAGETALIALYGTIDPARPLQTLVLQGDPAPSAAERFTRSQRDALLHDGISTHMVDAGGNVMLERPITTYQFNAAGFPDASYLDVTTLMTLSYLRYSLRFRMATKYPRHKLADDGIVVAPGQAIVTPKILSAEFVALAMEWQDAGLVENVDQFKSLLVVQRNAEDPSRVDALLPPDIVSGLREFAGSIQFAF